MLRQFLLMAAVVVAIGAGLIAAPQPAHAWTGWYYDDGYAYYLPPRTGYAYQGAPYYPGYGPPYYQGYGPPYYPGYGPPYTAGSGYGYYGLPRYNIYPRVASPYYDDGYYR